MITDDEINRIQQLCDAATPGPWRASVEGRDHWAGSSFIQTAADDIELLGAKEADYDFIACARQDIPLLLAEVRALRAAINQSDQAHKAPDSGH